MREEPPSPNNPPWNALAAFGVLIFSVLAILIFPLFFIIPYLVSTGKLNGADLQNDPTAVFLSVIAIIPAHAFTLLLSWFVVTRNRSFSFRETLGWKSGGSRWWMYLLILIGFFVFAGIINYFLPEQDNQLTQILRSSRATVLAVAFMATFTAPLVEEVVYRGILYSALQRSLGIGWAILVVTFLFASVHFFQYWGSPGTLISITVLSLILTLVRAKTNNLLPCIILHTIFNGIQAIFLILEPYLPKEMSPLQEKAAFFITF